MAAKEAAQRNVHAPSSREVPEIQEAPPPPKAEKHDDAFVDKLLKEKGLPKKKASVTNDEVDELLNQAKQDKPAQAAGKGSARSLAQAFLTNSRIHTCLGMPCCS